MAPRVCLHASGLQLGPGLQASLPWSEDLHQTTQQLRPLDATARVAQRRLSMDGEKGAGKNGRHAILAGRHFRLMYINLTKDSRDGNGISSQFCSNPSLDTLSPQNYAERPRWWEQEIGRCWPMAARQDCGALQAGS